MAVRIRMTRTGRLNRPFFRIGVFDSRTRRDGRVIEQLGYYDPILSTGTEWKLDQERLAFWMGKGAIPSERIMAYLRSQKTKHGGDRAKAASKAKARRKDRQESRRRTKRTVEATAKVLLAKNPKAPRNQPKPPPKPKAPKAPPAPAAEG